MSEVLERTDVANEEFRTKADGWDHLVDGDPDWWEPTERKALTPEGWGALSEWTSMAPNSQGVPLSERTTYSEAALLDQIEHSQRSQRSQGYPPLRTNEQNEVLGIFMQLLAGPTGDGGSKRAAGTKPSWKVDEHLARGAGHLHRYLHEGERFDKDSGCHPLVHAAWRFLAVAYQDMVAAGALPEDPR